MNRSRDAWSVKRKAWSVKRAALSVGRRVGIALVAALVSAPRATLHAQLAADTTAFYKALELESAGKYKEAAPLFRTALNTPSAVSALLGLERVYAELGWSDSLLAPLDTLIRKNPRETVYRSVQLRTLQSLGREDQLHVAIDNWVKQVPGDPSPYREYAPAPAARPHCVCRQRHTRGATGARLDQRSAARDRAASCGHGAVGRVRASMASRPCDVVVPRAGSDLRADADAGRNAERR
jgi:tetratricopeptide (TPR) repeat protein